jgi:hypothetical protein
MGITQNIGASSLIRPGVIDNAAARPASPYEGQAVYQKDTDQVFIYNGTAWVPTGNTTAWASYSPTITSSSGTITTVGAVSARYVEVNKTVYVYFSIVITTAGTASGQLRMTLPVTASGNMLTDTVVGSAREQANSGNLVQVFLSSSTQVGMLNYANGSQFANGNTFRGSIVYEAA